MNKKLLIVIGAIIVLLIAVVGYFVFKPASAPQPPPVLSESTSVTQEVTPTVAPKKITLRSLLGSSSSQKCEFSDDNLSSSGQVYIADGKIRVISTIDVSSPPNNVIINGDQMYYWVEGQTTGYALSSSITAGEATPSAANQSVDMDQLIDFSCQPWTVDSAKFELPSGIQFTDFSKLPLPDM